MRVIFATYNKEKQSPAHQLIHIHLLLMRCLLCRRDGIPVTAELCPNPDCGVYLPSLMRDVLPMGTLLRGESYRIDYPLGRGGFGITYRGIDVNLDMLVAIKEFYPQEHAIRNGKTGGLSVAAPQRNAFARGIERFKREGKILARLNHHNVVRVLGLFEERDTAYLVMELISGKTLRDELDAQKDKYLPPEQVQQIMNQLVEALAAVHEKEIYHLDLKPDNVLLLPDGKVVLVDFGAAKQSFSSNSTRAGTPSYAAPEVIAGGDIGTYSDIFELGMMLHEMLTGELPPPGLSRLMNDSWKPTGLEEPWLSQVTAAINVQQKARPQDVRLWWGSKTTHSSKTSGGMAGSAGRISLLVELKSDVGVDYTELERLLAAEKWYAADKETGRVMLKVARQEERGYLDYDDIKKFPCNDLRTIDQLWVQYSSGRFGFSVQKRILESVGGKPGKDDRMVYEQFGDRNGWRVKGNWISYWSGLVTFSKSAPVGHLPAGFSGMEVVKECEYVFGGFEFGIAHALLSRPDL